MGRDDKLHFFQGLDTALCLFCLVCLVPESPDIVFHVGDLALLFLEHALLVGQPLRSLALEMRIIARVTADSSVLDMQNSPTAAIDKLAVVGHHDQGTGVFPQPLLKPDNGVQVEVIGS